MSLTEFLNWLNANPGPTALIVAAITGALTAIGWVIAEVIRTMRRRANAESLPAIATSASHLDRIRADKRLRVGLLEYPPMMSLTHADHGRTAIGIYPRLLNRIAQAEALQLEWKILHWSEIVDAVTTGAVDVVASIFWTERRSERAAFCGKLHRIGVTGIVRAGETRIVDQEDLKRADVRIGVVRGEIGWEYAVDALDLKDNPQRYSVLDSVDIRRLADLLDRNLADVVLADGLSCRLITNANAELRQVFVDDKLFVCDNGFMVAKNNDTSLCQWIDSQARRFRNDPDLVAAEDADLAELKGIVRKRQP